jgi:hypothetical protein
MWVINFTFRPPFDRGWPQYTQDVKLARHTRYSSCTGEKGVLHLLRTKHLFLCSLTRCLVTTELSRPPSHTIRSINLKCMRGWDVQGAGRRELVHLIYQTGQVNKKTNWIDVDIDSRAVLKLILKNYDVMIFVWLIWLRIGFSYGI